MFYTIDCCSLFKLYECHFKIHDNFDRTSQHRLFFAYTDLLLGSVPLNRSLKSALTGVLLLHFDAVYEKYPTHQLIATLEEKRRQAEITVEMFNSWKLNCREFFVFKNGIYGNVSHMRDSDVIPVKDMREFIVQTSAQLEDMNKRIYSLETTVQQLNTVCEKAYNLLQLLQSGTVQPAAIAPPTVLSIRDTTITTTTSTSSNSNVTGSTPFPVSLMDSQKDLSLGSLFYQWYTRDLHRCEISPATKEREIMMRFALTIAYLKRFLPENAHIPPKPPLTNTLSSSYSSWTDRIRSYGDLAEKAAISFLKQENIRVHWDSNQRSTNSTGVKRKVREIGGKFHGCLKKMRDVPTELFPAPENVLDDATTSGDYLIDFADIRPVKKSKKTA